jgi:GNAT superfamily N-acetyltransferase
MIIRKAILSDVHGLAVLFNMYRMFYRKPTDIEAAKIFLAERINNNESVIFICEENNLLFGFAQLYPIFSSVGMKRLWLLNDLFVHPDFRGKGISKLLIQQCDLLAKETNASGVMLETEKTNEIGNRLYLQTGFKLIDNNFYFLENS